MRAKLGNNLMYLSPVPLVIIIVGDLQNYVDIHGDLGVNLSYSAGIAIIWFAIVAGLLSSVLLLGKQRLLGLAAAWIFFGAAVGSMLGDAAYMWWIVALVAAVAALLPEDAEMMDELANAVADLLISAFVAVMAIISTLFGLVMDAVLDVTAPIAALDHKLRRSGGNLLAKRFAFGLANCAALALLGFGLFAVARLV